MKSSATDMVSDADRAAEAAIVRRLQQHRPDDGILGEEGAKAAGASGRRWVIDPLDGTTNYLYGYPFWSVSVAVEDATGPLAAVVHHVLAAETYRAARGRGCDLNGTTVSVRDEDRLATALIATGFNYQAEVRSAQAESLRRVLPRVRDVRRAGSAAIDLASVAAGRVDGYYEVGLNPWDWAAGALLVTEAGGAVRVLDGDPPGVVAAGPSLIDALAGLVAA